MSIAGVGGASGAPFERRIDDEETSVTSVLLVDGDIGAQVAALAILSSQKQREANREIQVAEEAALQRAEAAQVEALHERADDIRMGGVIEGGFGVISGGCTIVGGFADSNSAARQYWSGGSKLADAGAKGFGSLPRAAQADADAIANTHEHAAGHHRRNLDAARDSTHEAQDLLERALDFYKQSQQTKADAHNSSVRRG